MGLLLAAGGCSPNEPHAEAPEPADAPQRPAVELVGRLQNRGIDEASGLVRSPSYANVYWVVNDSGKPRLHAIDIQGRTLGRIKIDDAGNSDWEDVASFSLDDKPYVVVADIGDNEGQRKDVRLYFVEEPEPGEEETDIAWQFDFTYPGGPRDAEAIAVDLENERVLVLSKREIPASLYSVPLRPDSKKRLKARHLAAISSLPQPGQRDLEMAPRTDNYWWQPTAMDIAKDNRTAVVLTYGGVFFYRRLADQTWPQAFQDKPLVLASGDYDGAESVAFDSDGTSIYITFEGRGAPIVRINIEELS